MSAPSFLVATPTFAPSLAAAIVFVVELVGIFIRYANSGFFEPYIYLIQLAFVRSVAEIMKIVWTRIDNPTETFIIVTEVLTKVGSVFVLLCLFRTLSYWVRMKCYPGQIVPPLMDRIMRLVTLIALIGQILGIVGVVKMMNETDYNTGVTLRDASRALLLLASVVFILLVLMNSARANDSTNAFILIILGVISVIRSAYDVVAIIVPSTSVIATNEIVQLCFDSIPEALAIGICIFYNLSRVTSTYMQNVPTRMDDIYEPDAQYNSPAQQNAGQYQSSYPPYSRKSGF
ncbi:hypothetical protein BGW37DRAFT_552447 [Umbelopsis sp. PMI_123]|nr:hypothetical protein BGW37DRAFT_552447 [Umbelopsis sp. PMI_123]